MVSNDDTVAQQEPESDAMDVDAQPAAADEVGFDTSAEEPEPPPLPVYTPSKDALEWAQDTKLGWDDWLALFLCMADNGASVADRTLYKVLMRIQWNMGAALAAPPYGKYRGYLRSAAYGAKDPAKDPMACVEWWIQLEESAAVTMLQSHPKLSLPDKYNGFPDDVQPHVRACVAWLFRPIKGRRHRPIELISSGFASVYQALDDPDVATCSYSPINGTVKGMLDDKKKNGIYAKIRRAHARQQRVFELIIARGKVGAMQYIDTEPFAFIRPDAARVAAGGSIAQISMLLVLLLNTHRTMYYFVNQQPFATALWNMDGDGKDGKVRLLVILWNLAQTAEPPAMRPMEERIVKLIRSLPNGNKLVSGLAQAAAIGDVTDEEVLSVLDTEMRHIWEALREEENHQGQTAAKPPPEKTAVSRPTRLPRNGTKR